MSLYLGIDLGTSYFKVGLFDGDGVQRGLGRVPVGKVSPAVGQYELPILHFWALLRSGLTQALHDAEAQATDIKGISYASQANTFVLLDDANRELTSLVLWTDARGEPVPRAMRDFAISDKFRKTAGFEGVDGTWAVAKWIWFRDQKPEIWRQTRRIMTISDYLTFSLTGELVGDAGTAAFLGLYDISNGNWWPEALQAFEVEKAYLSVPLRPGSRAGKTNASAQRLLGLPNGVPFSVGGLDHQVAALGTGIGSLANVSISTGTVLCAMRLIERPEVRSGCYHGPHFKRNEYYRLAFDAKGAGQLDEYQRSRAPGMSIEDLLDAARLQLPGHGAHIRRLLEEIALTQQKLVANVTGNETVGTIAATGGGARSPLWLQIQSDTIGTTVVAGECNEPASLGAAMLGAMGAGTFANCSEAASAMVRAAKSYIPRSLPKT